MPLPASDTFSPDSRSRSASLENGLALVDERARGLPMVLGLAAMDLVGRFEVEANFPRRTLLRLLKKSEVLYLMLTSLCPWCRPFVIVSASALWVSK